MSIAFAHILAESKEQVLYKTRAVSYSEVASVTILTWDVLITLSDEVHLIWRKRWTPAQVMYMFARYLPLFFQLALLGINADGSTGLFFNLFQCRQWIAVQAVILQLIITTVDVILMTRVYALYNRNRILLGVMVVLFMAEISFLSYVLSFVAPRLTFNDDCFVTSSPPLFVAYWITSLVYETILFALTLAKFVVAVRQGWGKSSVIKMFVADGTWAYFLIFVAMFVNSMFYKVLHNPLAGICFTWLLSVLSFAGSRLVLNPRRRARSDDADDSDPPYSPGGDPRTNLSASIELDKLPTSPVSPLTPRSPLTPLTPPTPGSPRSHARLSYVHGGGPGMPHKKAKVPRMDKIGEVSLGDDSDSDADGDGVDLGLGDGRAGRDPFGEGEGGFGEDGRWGVAV